MQNILIIGKDGQVGRELQRSVATLGTVQALGRESIDLAQPHQVYNVLTQLKPDVIINAAAYTAVDRAESEPELAYAINAQAVQKIAEYAQQANALMVHYSTDYVFDGNQNTPYTEQTLTAPKGVYGSSKRAGEEAIQNLNPAHFIFRTSWVYAAHSNNFLRTMMRLAMERDQLQVVDDQIGTPTSAALVADITALALWAYQQKQLQPGLYHLTASGQTSWHGFAHFIVQTMVEAGLQPKVSPDQVLAIPTSDYPTPAARPAYSCLDNQLLARALAVQFPDWTYHAKLAVGAAVRAL